MPTASRRKSDPKRASGLRPKATGLRLLETIDGKSRVICAACKATVHTIEMPIPIDEILPLVRRLEQSHGATCTEEGQ